MGKKNFYAVRRGIDPKTMKSVENIILTTWAETESYIKGVKSSEYSGFTTRGEAESYLNTKDPLVNINDEILPKDFLHCYVDGSFNKSIPNYSFGLVCEKDEKVTFWDNGIGKNPEAISMQQIGGEFLGAMNALLYAKNNGYKKVAIIHDYKGVCYHATGYWKRDNNFSEVYYQWMQKFFKDHPDIEVKFFKVDAHVGHDWNEIADGLAKIAAGIEPNSIFYKMTTKHNIDLKRINIQD